MTHLTEEQLVWHFYGETADPGETADAAIAQHLEVCSRCQGEYRALEQVLQTVGGMEIPERALGYEQRVWRELENKLPKHRSARWWILVPAAAALLVTAFLAGRISKQPGIAPPMAAAQVRERILLVAVGDHLERSQMVLAEIGNAPDGKGKIDISDERQLAVDLLDNNRLYRLTARRTGDTAMASVLDDLERVLMEIANSPPTLSSDQLEQFRKQIADRGLLFKVRVVGAQARRRESSGTKF